VIYIPVRDEKNETTRIFSKHRRSNVIGVYYEKLDEKVAASSAYRLSPFHGEHIKAVSQNMVFGVSTYFIYGLILMPKSQESLCQTTDFSQKLKFTKLELPTATGTEISKIRIT
jgi:hypothetical protein